MSKYIILHVVFLSLSLIILTLYFNGKAFGAAVSFPWLQIEEKLPVTGKVSGSVTVQTITGASAGGGSCEQCQFVIYHPKTSAPSSAVIAHTSTTPLDLSGAKRIVFFAKGELGGETIKAVAIGKLNPKIPGEKPPFTLISPNIVLTTDWKRYELSLKGLDLKDIISPFGLEISNQRSGSPILNPPIEKTPLNNRNAKDISIYLKGVSLDDKPAANPLNATTFNSSGQTLTAKIVANSTGGPAPHTIEFEGNATGGLAPYSYGWNFDVDNNSTAVSPKVLRTFDEPRNYTITLGVKDSGSPPQNASAIMVIRITPSANSTVNSTSRVEVNSTSNNGVNSTSRVEVNSTSNNGVNSTNSELQSISEGNNMINSSAKVALVGVGAYNSSAIGQATTQEADRRNNTTQAATIFQGLGNERFAMHGTKDKNIGADEFTTPFGSNLTDANNADGIASDNHAPIAIDQIVIIYINEATDIVLKGTDPDKDLITFEIVSGPLKGTLAGFNKQTGTVTYIPNRISPASDSFSFKVIDIHNGESNVAHVSETIKAKPSDENTKTDLSPSDQSPNSAPVVRDEKIEIDQNKKVRIILQGIDADHDKLTYSVVDDPSHGELISFDSSTGKLTYSPEDNFAGQDIFKFKATDQKGVDSKAAKVLIKVNVGVREHSNNGADLSSVEKVPADQISPSASPVINSNPTVNAGPDRVVYTGTNNVVLKGHADDPDGDTLSYSWEQTAGWNVDLRNPNSAEPSFNIPAIVEDKVLGFVLTVSDGRGGQDTDDVKIIIKDRLNNRAFQDRIEPLQTFNHTLQLNR